MRKNHPIILAIAIGILFVNTCAAAGDQNTETPSLFSLISQKDSTAQDVTDKIEKIVQNEVGEAVKLDKLVNAYSKLFMIIDKYRMPNYNIQTVQESSVNKVKSAVADLINKYKLKDLPYVAGSTFNVGSVDDFSAIIDTILDYNKIVIINNQDSSQSFHIKIFANEIKDEVSKNLKHLPFHNKKQVRVYNRKIKEIVKNLNNKLRNDSKSVNAQIKEFFNIFNDFNAMMINTLIKYRNQVISNQNTTDVQYENLAHKLFAYYSALSKYNQHSSLASLEDMRMLLDYMGVVYNNLIHGLKIADYFKDYFNDKYKLKENSPRLAYIHSMYSSFYTSNMLIIESDEVDSYVDAYKRLPNKNQTFDMQVLISLNYIAKMYKKQKVDAKEFTNARNNFMMRFIYVNLTFLDSEYNPDSDFYSQFDTYLDNKNLSLESYQFNFMKIINGIISLSDDKSDLSEIKLNPRKDLNKELAALLSYTANDIKRKLKEQLIDDEPEAFFMAVESINRDFFSGFNNKKKPNKVEKRGALDINIPSVIASKENVFTNNLAKKENTILKVIGGLVPDELLDIIRKPNYKEEIKKMGPAVYGYNETVIGTLVYEDSKCYKTILNKIIKELPKRNI